MTYTTDTTRTDRLATEHANKQAAAWRVQRNARRDRIEQGNAWARKQGWREDPQVTRLGAYGELRALAES